MQKKKKKKNETAKKVVISVKNNPQKSCKNCKIIEKQQIE